MLYDKLFDGGLLKLEIDERCVMCDEGVMSGRKS